MFTHMHIIYNYSRKKGQAQSPDNPDQPATMSVHREQDKGHMPIEEGGRRRRRLGLNPWAQRESKATQLDL